MAIKKISELERLPASLYKNGEELKDESLDKMLFETSYDMGEKDECFQYVSYNITLGDFKDMLHIDDILETLSNLLSGTITINGQTFFGVPSHSEFDKDGCGYYYDKNDDNYVIFYSKVSCCNLTKFYNYSEFHNDVTIRGHESGDEGATVRYMPGTILSCQGNSYFDNPIHGVAMSAWWADLAEYYKADYQYDPGTLIEFGGNEEITIATNKCNAVVTSKPGLVLNANNKSNMVGIALTGRVPIKIKGKVKKFDNIILSKDPGIGIVNNNIDNKLIIGKSMESSDNEEIKLIECVTQFNLI